MPRLDPSSFNYTSSFSYKDNQESIILTIFESLCGIYLYPETKQKQSFEKSHDLDGGRSALRNILRVSSRSSCRSNIRDFVSSKTYRKFQNVCNTTVGGKYKKLWTWLTISSMLQQSNETKGEENLFVPTYGIYGSRSNVDIENRNN